MGKQRAVLKSVWVPNLSAILIVLKLLFYNFACSTTNSNTKKTVWTKFCGSPTNRSVCLCETTLRFYSPKKNHSPPTSFSHSMKRCSPPARIRRLNRRSSIKKCGRPAINKFRWWWNFREAGWESVRRDSPAAGEKLRTRQIPKVRHAGRTNAYRGSPPDRYFLIYDLLDIT